eukprot:2286173-Pyramimonas_sp.AAC.1
MSDAIAKHARVEPPQRLPDEILPLLRPRAQWSWAPLLDRRHEDLAAYPRIDCHGFSYHPCRQQVITLPDTQPPTAGKATAYQLDMIVATYNAQRAGQGDATEAP